MFYLVLLNCIIMNYYTFFLGQLVGSMHISSALLHIYSIRGNCQLHSSELHAKYNNIYYRGSIVLRIQSF